jgi:hypothetical protein
MNAWAVSGTAFDSTAPALSLAGNNRRYSRKDIGVQDSCRKKTAIGYGTMV